MQRPSFIKVTFMKMMYYVLKLQLSKRRPIINTWTTSVQTLESRRLDINVGDVLAEVTTVRLLVLRFRHICAATLPRTGNLPVD